MRTTLLKTSIFADKSNYCFRSFESELHNVLIVKIVQEIMKHIDSVTNAIMYFGSDESAKQMLKKIIELVEEQYNYLDVKNQPQLFKKGIMNAKNYARYPHADKQECIRHMYELVEMFEKQFK
ncbi:hypothetical protein [Bacillus safensis]|uniref:Uncharacterized protein n=1 Tax=Bacillus safensis TaxID=561879 RepID=A0A1L6ZPE3_BACIA|nr:hypothetical protein [Bacillus safensis]APT48379.1 hypothetical protein BSA145_21185 [Bacillus safensis]